MPGRFVDLETMAPEIAAEIDRYMTLIGALVQADHDQDITIVIEMPMPYNKALGQVTPKFRKFIRCGAGPFKTAGYVRDGQCQLPGTGILSNMEPEDAEDAAARNGNREHSIVERNSHAMAGQG